jgi:hypothetical protein
MPSLLGWLACMFLSQLTKTVMLLLWGTSTACHCLRRSRLSCRTSNLNKEKLLSSQSDATFDAKVGRLEICAARLSFSINWLPWSLLL